MCLLSIIITAYNIEDYLRRCVESIVVSNILAHQYEIIIVDDGSNDTTLAIAKELATQYANIMVVNSNRLLNGGSRNEGMKHSRGRYLKFVDGDDYVDSENLSKAFTFLQTTDIEIVGHDFLKVDENGVTSRYDNTRFPFGKIMTGAQFLNRCTPCRAVWFCFYRRDFVQNSGILFRPFVYHEDEDFYIKIFSQASRVIFIPLVVYYYFYNRPHSTINNPDPAHFSLRMSHYMSLFRELRQYEAASPDNYTTQGIRCNAYAAVVSYIRLLMRYNYPPTEVAEKLDELSKLDYYPLPQRNYGLKYFIFRIFANHPSYLLPLIRRFC